MRVQTGRGESSGQSASRGPCSEPPEWRTASGWRIPTLKCRRHGSARNYAAGARNRRSLSLGGVTIRVRGLTFELRDAVYAQAGVRSQARRLIRSGWWRVHVNGPEPREYAGAHVSDSVEYRARVPPVVTGKSDLRTDTAFPARSPKTNYPAEGRQGGGLRISAWYPPRS